MSDRPIAHVAAEAGISRQRSSKWKARFDERGEAGLVDRASVPHTYRCRTAVGDQPPASRLYRGIANVLSQNN